MKEIEKRAYQAAIVKATVVRYFLEEAKPELKGKSPSDRANSAKLLKSVVEQAMVNYGVDDLVPGKELSRRDFQAHIMALVMKLRKPVEERLKVISKAE